MANKNPNSTDEFGFAKLTVPELNKVIADLVKSNNKLNEEKKEYVKATTEVVHENIKRIKAALVARETAKLIQADKEHELSVKSFMAASGAN